MLAQDYLTLRLIRIRGDEEWKSVENGLSFILCRAGSGRCAGQGGVHLVSGGDVLVLGSEGRMIGGGEMMFWFFSIRLEHLFPLFEAREICLVQKVHEAFKRAKKYEAKNPLAIECHRLVADVPPQFNLDHRSQLLRVAASIVSLEFKEAQAQRVGYVRAEDHMVQVFEKLSSHELLTLSVGELAEKFSCSRRHLNRLFHQHFGSSVAALRMEMRLLKAVSLLRDPDIKIINVAEQCGFNHLGLFNTCFRKRFGSSPGQWRKLTAAKSGQRKDNDPACPLHTNGLCPWSGNPQIRTAIPQELHDVQKDALSKNGGPNSSGLMCATVLGQAVMEAAIYNHNQYPLNA